MRGLLASIPHDHRGGVTQHVNIYVCVCVPHFEDLPLHSRTHREARALVLAEKQL